MYGGPCGRGRRMKGMRDLIEKILYEYKMGGNLKFVADSHLTLVIMNRIKFFSRKLPSFTSASRCEKFKIYQNRRSTDCSLVDRMCQWGDGPRVYSGGMETVVRSRGMVLVWIGSVIRSKFVLRNVSLDFYQTRKELGKVAPSILPPARSAPVSFSATPPPPLIK